jgi:hypothetical protein
VSGHFLTLADLQPEKELAVPTGQDAALNWIRGCCGEEKNLCICQELNPVSLKSSPQYSHYVNYMKVINFSPHK